MKELISQRSKYLILLLKKREISLLCITVEDQIMINNLPAHSMSQSISTDLLVNYHS